MAIENLPRPWVLAALTGLKMTELVEPPADAPPQPQPPRHQARRRRLRDAAEDCRPRIVSAA